MKAGTREMKQENPDVRSTLRMKSKALHKGFSVKEEEEEETKTTQSGSCQLKYGIQKGGQTAERATGEASGPTEYEGTWDSHLQESSRQR